MAGNDRGLFQPEEAVKTMNTTRVLLYSMWGTFLWWCRGLIRPKMGDRRRERESPARGERCSEISYGVNACMVHWYRWTLYAVGSRMKRSDGCDWLDLQVDRTVRIVWVLILCGAVHRKLGTPGDVAQRDQILNYFNGSDVLGYVWYFSNCFFKNIISYSREEKLEKILNNSLISLFYSQCPRGHKILSLPNCKKKNQSAQLPLWQKICIINLFYYIK